MTTLALSRTCDLDDFPHCLTVAAWQQALAEHAWTIWLEAFHVRTREHSVCFNYAGFPFTAPGPEAIYRYPGDASNGINHIVPAIYGLSVLDQITAPVRFLTRAAQYLRTHGLLFLTFPFWDAEGPDVASGCQDRKRIYDVHSLQKLIGEARRQGFRTFGGLDWTYHGDKLGDGLGKCDHSFASLVLTRAEEKGR